MDGAISRLHSNENEDGIQDKHLGAITDLLDPIKGKGKKAKLSVCFN
jgi:hypothetical protein